MITEIQIQTTKLGMISVSKTEALPVYLKCHLIMCGFEHIDELYALITSQSKQHSTLIQNQINEILSRMYSPKVAE